MIDKQINNLKQIIIELQHKNKEKHSKIIYLQRIIQEQACQLRQKQMVIKSLELMSKQRAKTINKKEVQIYGYEDKIVQLQKHAKNVDHLHKKILQLQEIIRQQNSELLQLLQDNELYISNFESFAQVSIETTQERDFLLQYNSELSGQIEQVQKINQSLINRCEEDQNQVKLQNEQGSDLLGQIQYMIEFYQGVCEC